MEKKMEITIVYLGYNIGLSMLLFRSYLPHQ